MDTKEPIVHGHDHHVRVNGQDHADSYQADEALQTLHVAQEKHLHLDAATSTRLRRRADLFIMPVSNHLVRICFPSACLTCHRSCVWSTAYSFSTVRLPQRLTVRRALIMLIVEIGTSLSYASVMGITKELKLVGQDYSWISSVFFFGPARIPQSCDGTWLTLDRILGH